MLAIKNAKIHTVANGIIERGTVIVRDGKIAAVGVDLPIPADCEIVDATGLTLMPGIVEAHCHVASMEADDDDMMDGGESGGGWGLPAATPELDYWYAFNPRSEGLKRAVAAGITTIMTGPGSGKIISGTNFAAKTAGDSRKQMIIKNPVGLKMAFGENPKRNYGSRHQMPSTRMGSAAVLREALIRAQNYMRKQEAAARGVVGANGKPVEAPPLDYKLEPIVKVLKRELKARVHAHRADDIMTVLRIRDEFGIDITIEHASEADHIIDEVAKRGVPCIVGPTYISRSKVETRGKTFATPGRLERAGIKVAITTDAGVVPIEYLRMSASLAYREGMSEAGTIRAITLSAAEILGVEDRVGSIEVGKDADLVLLNGHPLSLLTTVQKVWVDGVKRWDREIDKEAWEK
ncbi:MAG: amidohydrolase [Chloroflexota bacterium]